MKTGYSNILGEVVEASELDYGDCKDFQIVCPCCHEAVFKKERAGSGPDGSHFLSHYPETEPDKAAECERRVARMTKEDFARMNSKGRGQALDEFLGVLPQKAIQTFGDIPPEVVQHAMRKFLKCGEVPGLIASFKKFLIGKSGKDFTKFVDASLKGANFEPGIANMVQSFVCDTYEHLLTVQARDTFAKLVGVAAFMAALDASWYLMKIRSGGGSDMVQNEYIGLAGILPIAALPSGSSVYKTAHRKALEMLRTLKGLPVPAEMQFIYEAKLAMLADRLNEILFRTGINYLKPNTIKMASPPFDPNLPLLHPWFPREWLSKASQPDFEEAAALYRM